MLFSYRQPLFNLILHAMHFTIASCSLVLDIPRGWHFIL